jgi:cyclophilin family peptidyl-prolyl cis-trans isomerase
MKKSTAFLALLFALTTLLTAFAGCTQRKPSAIISYDYSQMNVPLPQIEAIEGKLYEGQPIATVTTSLGVIRIALFPEYAPNTVEGFIDRTLEGFYNDTSVMQIQQEAVFYAGLGTDGYPHLVCEETGDNLSIQNEYSVNMWPFKGALGAFGWEQGVSDSRFFILDEETLTDEEWARFRKMPVKDGEPLPEKLIDSLEEVGCAIAFAGFYTIFGQTIEGLDIVQAISKSPVDNRQRPENEIKIISIEIEYHKENKVENEEH